jgi:hypothetical protein
MDFEDEKTGLLRTFNPAHDSFLSLSLCLSSILSLSLFLSWELIRLMNTSCDENKKAIIRESLNILDSPRKKVSNGKKISSQGILFQHANAFETETVGPPFIAWRCQRRIWDLLFRSVEISQNHLPSVRWAQRFVELIQAPPLKLRWWCSSSFSWELYCPHSLTSDLWPLTRDLQTINTNLFLDDAAESSPSRMNHLESSTAVTFSSQNCIQFDDLSNVTISGHDPSRMRDWNPFSITPGSPKWISTGMIPQSLLIHLKHCWYITEVWSCPLSFSYSWGFWLSSPSLRSQW